MNAAVERRTQMKNEVRYLGPELSHTYRVHGFFLSSQRDVAEASKAVLLMALLFVGVVCVFRVRSMFYLQRRCFRAVYCCACQKENLPGLKHHF